MNSNTLSEIFEQDEKTGLIVNHLENYSASRLQLAGLVGSSRSITVAAVYNQLQTNHLVILPDKEASAYFLNDLENLFGEKSYSYHKKKILFYQRLELQKNYLEVHYLKVQQLNSLDLKQ